MKSLKVAITHFAIGIDSPSYSHVVAIESVAEQHIFKQAISAHGQAL